MSAGYSQTPLAKKLGIKEGFVIRLSNSPEYYYTLFSDFPEKVIVSADKKIKKHFIHYFVKQRKELTRDIASLRKEIFPDGMIWVS